jgi:hypothetical protein
LTAKLPNFFIVGAPKAGTTSLYYYLDQHPDIYMSSIKEPHFFSAEVREENCDPDLGRTLANENHGLLEYLSGPMREKRFGGIVSDWEDYIRLFAKAGAEKALGEASVCYLWSQTAPAAIAGRVPNAKIIVMLRDPAERAFSQYLHGVGNGAIRWTFREHIRRAERYGSKQLCVYYPFLEFGRYSEQLVAYRQRFQNNVWVGFYDDFTRSPAQVCRTIYRFLGVDDGFEPDMSRRHLEAQVPRLRIIARMKHSGIWGAAANVTPRSLRPFFRRALIRKAGTTRMDRADRRYLHDYYREEIKKLEGLVGRDLSGWLSEPI